MTHFVKGAAASDLLFLHIFKNNTCEKETKVVDGSVPMVDLDGDRPEESL